VSATVKDRVLPSDVRVTGNVAVLIPCYNEEVTIGKVVADFQAALPDAQIYVYDNNSKDGTRRVAHRAGAVVRTELLQGKGHVVRRMFADVEADIYVLVDGDDTYDAGTVSEMIDLLIADNLDMVTGTREHESNDAYRRGHQFGNAMLTGAVRMIFGARISDMLSGYRVFSRRFVKSFPALSAGFETETEFTVHALELQMPVGEQLIRYGVRPAGSVSKLNTIRDGIRIARTIIVLVKDERPLPFFSAIALLMFLVALLLGGPVISEFVRTGLVPRFPTAILSASLVLLSFLTLASGMILDTVSHGRRELKRLFYLSLPSPVALRERKLSRNLDFLPDNLRQRI
jgi:glycosyltransferase involved in cell wall biosynthesis